MAKSKLQKWVTGLAVSATAVVGLSSLKNNDAENAQSLDEPTSANQTINQADTNTMSVEGASFNLDADNPEIVVAEKEPTVKDFVQALEQQILHTFDFEDIQSLEPDERERIVNQIAKDYRACEKSVQISGGIDSELVGESNICSKYFDKDGDATLEAHDVYSMVNLVMLENYAEKLDGLPRNVQQQQMYDKLGPEFSKFYQATVEWEGEGRSEIMESAQSFIKDEVGDLAHLTDNLDSPEALEAQAQLDELKQAYIDSNTLNLETKGLSESEILAHTNVAEYSIGHVTDLENYIETYNIDIADEFDKSINDEFSDQFDFARQIRFAADKLGVSDDIKMTYSHDTEKLTIIEADLEVGR